MTARQKYRSSLSNYETLFIKMSRVSLKSFILLVWLVWCIACTNGTIFSCISREFGHGSSVCVCNSTYCDRPTQLGPLPKKSYFQIISSKDGQRLQLFEGNKSLEECRNDLIQNCIDRNKDAKPVIELTVNRNQKYQKIIGFGGAFTDSAGINIDSLPLPLQATIIESYYSDHGLQYNIARIPMGGSDFSTRKYSYDDVPGDTELKHFDLAEEDLKFKIPFLTEALKMRPNLKILASPWSAPKWMKTNDEFTGLGSLKKEFYQLWADYFRRFLEEYAKQNLTIWAVTAQNEPVDGQIPGFSFNCMGWTAEQQRDWIKNNLGPTLKKSEFGSVKIIILDDQRPFLNAWTRTILSDPDAAKYISGIGLHWYLDYFPPAVLDIANSEYPGYFLISTEACAGSLGGEHEVLLGSWERAENYAEDIIEDLNHWVTGWIDWNLALDLNGGPNWANNFVDAPIIVDNITNVIYKQPMFYILGHFSKYIPENSVRISAVTSPKIKGFEVLTVLRPDESIATVVLNKLDRIIQLKITEEGGTDFIQVDVGPRSIQTIIY